MVLIVLLAKKDINGIPSLFKVENKNISEQIKGDLLQKTYTRQLWNVLDLQISFWAIGQKCLEKNTKNN